MTTTVSVKTHERPATVRQLYTAAMGDDAGDTAIPITVPPYSEMQFAVYDGVDLMVSEEPAG